VVAQYMRIFKPAMAGRVRKKEIRHADLVHPHHDPQRQVSGAAGTASRLQCVATGRLPTQTRNTTARDNSSERYPISYIDTFVVPSGYDVTTEAKAQVVVVTRRKMDAFADPKVLWGGCQHGPSRGGDCAARPGS
jgi:hypothetical protein